MNQLKSVNNRYTDTPKTQESFKNKSLSLQEVPNQTSVQALSSPISTKLLGPPIKNDIGEQNCFLNVLIHAFYQIKEVRNFFLQETIKNDARSNLFFELQKLIEHYTDIMSPFSRVAEQFKNINPSHLRSELADLFKEDNRFKLNSMDDPVEALFVFLNSFHSYSINAGSLKYIIDKPCNPNCLSHELFWINILEQYQCECGATSEVLKYDYNYFIYEVYVKEILNMKDTRAEAKSFQHKFFNFLKKLNSTCENNITCPEKCHLNNVRKNLYLLNSTPYLNFNLVWRETNPKLADICKLFLMLPLKFTNKDLFELPDGEISKQYELFGLVCYWGSHYISFFRSDEFDANYWVCYDDTVITKVNSWKELIVKCLKGHFHPTILFYRKIDSEKSFGQINEMKEQISNDEMNKFLIYCENFDKENQMIYKNEEWETSRLRPSNSDKKKSNEDLTKIIGKMKQSTNYSNTVTETGRETGIGISTSHKNLNKSRMDIDEENAIENNDVIKNKNYNNQPDSPYMPSLQEDEWICENEICLNINKLFNPECLKCKKINQNVYDIIIQQKMMDRNRTNYSNSFNYLKNSTSSQVNHYDNQKNLDNVLRNKSVNKRIDGNDSITSNNRERETKIDSNINLHKEFNLKATKFDSTAYSVNNKIDKLYSSTEPITSTNQIKRNPSVPHKAPPISQQENTFIKCNCNYTNYSSKKTCERCGSVLDASQIVTRSYHDNYINKNPIPLGSSLNKMITNNSHSNSSLNSSISNLSSNKIKSIPGNKYDLNSSIKGSSLTNNGNKKFQEWICEYCKKFNKKYEEFCEYCQKGNSKFTGYGTSKNNISSFNQNNSLSSSTLNLKPTVSNQNYSSNFRHGSNLSNPLGNYGNVQKPQVAIKPTYIPNNIGQNTNEMRRSTNLDLNYLKSGNGMYSNQSNQSSQSYLYNGNSSSGRNLSVEKNTLTRSRSVRR